MYKYFIHGFLVFLLIVYSAPLLIIFFCMFKSSYFAAYLSYIKQFATSYESYSIWRSFILANLLIPLFTSISTPLLEPPRNRTKIPIFSIVLGFLLVLGVIAGLLSNQIVISAQESLRGYGIKVYRVFNSITSESIKEYLTFFAILFGISTVKRITK